jgi:hypothetical protein
MDHMIPEINRPAAAMQEAMAACSHFSEKNNGNLSASVVGVHYFQEEIA